MGVWVFFLFYDAFLRHVFSAPRPLYVMLQKGTAVYEERNTGILARINKIFEMKYAIPVASGLAAVFLLTEALVLTGIGTPRAASDMVASSAVAQQAEKIESPGEIIGGTMAGILDGKNANEAQADAKDKAEDAKTSDKDKQDGEKKDANDAKDANNNSEAASTSLLDAIQDGIATSEGHQASGSLENAGEFVANESGEYVWQPNASSGSAGSSGGSSSASGSNSSGGSSSVGSNTGGGSASSGGSGYVAPSGGGNASSGGGSSSTPTPAPAQQQRWVEATYKTVNHPEEGHWETYTDYETVTVQKVICGGTDHNPGDPNYCGESPVWDSYEGWKAHQEAFLAEMRKTDPYYQCTGRHRPAKYIDVQEQRAVEKQRWVVDRAAWTEQVVDVPGHWE